MPLKITIARLGFAVIIIPAMVLMSIIGWLYVVQTEQERYTAEISRARRITNLVNDAEKQIFEVVSSVHGDKLFDDSFQADQYDVAVSTMNVTYQSLENAVGNDPRRLEMVRRARQSVQDALNLLEQGRKDYNSGLMPPKSNLRKDFFKKMQGFLKNVASGDILDMGREAQVMTETDPVKQAAFNQSIRNIQLAGGFAGVVLSIGLGVMLNNFVIRRLNLIIDNSYRLASDRPLNPPLKGSDEIATLDHAFHDMADALVQATKNERAIIDNASDVLATLDNRGTFVDVNPASLKVLGYPPSELKGSRLINIVYSSDVQDTIANLRQIMTGAADPFETRLQRKDGQIIDVEFSANWDEKERTMFCVLHDVTERKFAERMRKEVMAMVSHDLKTPLATIRSFLEMLETGMFGELNERGQRLLSLADRSSSRMITLIKDLLDIEKMESGMLELHKEVVKVSSLFEQSIHGVSSMAGEAGVELQAMPTELSVYADPDRMVQVLVNLLSNAVKFSPKGGVVRLSVEKAEGFMVLRVSDQGRGIPAHLTQSIFDRFKQVQASDAKEKGGSGLGLAICKALVELHGGQIKVDSQVDQGSTFSFRIPHEEEAEVSITSSSVPYPKVTA